MNQTAPDSVLIVRMSSIGDVIHTLPAFVALREAWPEARFGWVTEPAAAPLLRAIDGAPTVHVLDTQRWRRRFWRPAAIGGARRAVAELRAGGYELAIDFQGLIKSAAVARLTGAAVLGLASADLREPLARRLYDRCAEPSDPEGHVIDRSLNLAAAAGAVAGTEAVRFPTLETVDGDDFIEANLAGLGLQRFAVMHGAANWNSKRWRSESLATLGRDFYRRTGLPVLWTWGPGEHTQTMRLATAAGEGNLASFPTDLPQLAALLRRAELFVGGDSAPLHLAVAVGAPVVAIFGPTAPRRLGPVSKADRSVVNLQPCSHCHQRHCPIGTRACLDTLRPEVVLEAALERLATSSERAG